MSLLMAVIVGYSLYVLGQAILVITCKNPKSRYYFRPDAPASARVLAIILSSSITFIIGVSVILLLATPIAWAFLGLGLIAYLMFNHRKG